MREREWERGRDRGREGEEREGERKGEREGESIYTGMTLPTEWERGRDGGREGKRGREGRRGGRERAYWDDTPPTRPLLIDSPGVVFCPLQILHRELVLPVQHRVPQSPPAPPPGPSPLTPPSCRLKTHCGHHTLTHILSERSNVVYHYHQFS